MLRANLKISLVMGVLLVGIHCTIAVGTESYIIADDMEGYNDRSDIREVWTDGYHNVIWGTGDYTVVRGGSSGSNLNVSSAVGGYGPGGAGPIPPTPFNYEAMVLCYDNDGYTYTGLPGEEKWVYDAPYYSEIEANTFGTNSLGIGQNWSGEGFESLSMLFQGHPQSDGYIDVSAWPMYTIYARGRDIQGRYDEFYYLSQYPLTSFGDVLVQVLSMDSTDPSAKAGVMIREKWTPYSKHASIFITPSSGIIFSYRSNEDGPTTSITKPGVTAPQYLRLERIINGEFRAYHSDNGFIWHYVNAPGSQPVFPIIPMGTVSDPGVYIGSVVTGRNSGQMCSADFDKFVINPYLPNWIFGNIGTNDPEQLYVALEDSAGNVGVVRHNDINASTRTTWQKWNIPLTEFANVNLNSVRKIYIGLGDRDAPVQGGSGTLYIDDIMLRRPLFVDADAPAGGNGSSWAEAFNNLQDALSSTKTGDEIRVAQGIYKPAGYVTPPPPPPPPPMGGSNAEEPVATAEDRNATFQLKNGVVIKGGYAGFGEPNANARDIGTYVTILSGDIAGDDGPDFTNNDENCYHVVTGSGTDATAILDGFTITAGNANAPSYEDTNSQGGGMFNDTGSPTLTNCMFVGNAARWDGAGIYNSFCNSLLTNCTFRGNSAGTPSGGHGGGMYNYRSSPTLTNCTFSGNWAGQGGGMSNMCYSSPTIRRCIFSNNSANFGAGMGAKDCSSIILTRCTFSGNSAGGRGGGAEYINSSPTLTSCTFVGNSAASRYGGGISIMSNSNPTVTNCTFVANSAPEGRALACDSSSQRPSDLWVTNSILWDGGEEIVNKDDSTITIIYSDVQGGWLGEGNIDADPCFVVPGYFGPIAYWKLDEGGGTTAYDSEGQNHGTVYGAQWTTGQVGGALSFDGSGDLVEVPDDTSLNITGDITISAWVYLTQGGSYQAIVTKCVGRGPTNNPFDFRTNVSAEPLLTLVRAGATGHERVYSNKHLSLNQWYHVLVKVENKVPDFYVDGIVTGKWADTTFTKTPTGNTKPLLIGARDDGLHFHGIIDEVAIYDRALSDEEIIQLYESSGYRLLPVSPCINAGDPDYIAGPNETDLDGKPRVIAGRIDMGAYEFNHKPVADAGPDQTIEAQAPWGATVTLDGSGSSDADCTPGTFDDITDFNWYELDPCDPSTDIFLGSGAIIDCNLAIGEHTIFLKVIDRAGASDTNEVTIIVQDTTPPVFTSIPQDLIVECDGSGNLNELNAWLASAAAVDECGDVNITNDFAGLLNSCGATGSATVVWTAEDEYGNTTTTPPATFTIVDTTPPVITCPPDVTLECPADTSVEANGSATAGDTCGTVTITHSDQWQPDCGSTGILTRTWTATDECGNESSCVQVITVVDTTPPEFELSVSPAMLWPPNHKMVEITPTWTVSDECDSSPEVSLVSIVANEADDIIGDGHTSNDIQIDDDGSIFVRSERSGTDTGRVYTITYQAVDDCGNVTVRSAAVSIPHDFKVLARIASRWLWSGPAGRIPEDLNVDGVVNLADFAEFAGNWTR